MISVGDELQLDILDDEAEPYPLRVGGDGEVQLPFVGSVALAGKGLLEARDFIAKTYVEKNIFVDPPLDLSVVNLRPFSVIGDVQEPGFFDYRPGITVEQAVGLAGGIRQPLGGEEARALQRAALRGELFATERAMLREAVVAARLRTQLKGNLQIDPTQVETPDVSQPDPAFIASLVAQENEIIAAEETHFEADRALVKRAVEEVTLQISLMEKQIEAQKEQVASYDDELASNASLTERGLVAAPIRAQLLRRVADEETALLRLSSNLAETRRDYTGLERELLGMQYRRLQEWRTALSDSRLKASQLEATRESLLDRLALLRDWSKRSVDDEGENVTLAVRRRTPEGGIETLDVKETDAVQPGDVVVVRQIRDRLRQQSGVVESGAETRAETQVESRAEPRQVAGVELK